MITGDFMNQIESICGVFCSRWLLNPLGIKILSVSDSFILGPNLRSTLPKSNENVFKKLLGTVK